MITETFIEPTSEEIMAVLLARRKALHLSQATIAERTRSSLDMIKLIESGKSLSLTDLCKYAAAVDALLNVNLVTDLGSQRKKED